MPERVRFRTEEKPFISRGPVAPIVTATPPGLLHGSLSNGCLGSSRWEALQQFHHLEMMVEVDGCMQVEGGLVLSDEGDDVSTGELKKVSVARDALHDAREELAGKTLNMDAYSAENVWQEAKREARLESGHDWVEDNGAFLCRSTVDGVCGVLEGETHESIMDELGMLESRMEQIRERQRSRWRRTHISAGSDGEIFSEEGESSSELSPTGESEFDPDRYIKPLLCHMEGVGGTDITLQQQWLPMYEDREAVCPTDIRNILPDDMSVQEALRLVQYNIHSNHPDVVACVQRCSDNKQQIQEQQQGQHLSSSENPPVDANQDYRNTEKDASVNLSSRCAINNRMPSVAQLAELVAKTLPEIPEDLRQELTEQRRLLERLAAAQEENIRQQVREKRENTRRHIMASPVDPTLGPLAPSTLHRSEPYEVAQALQSLQKDSNKPLPPVITITTMRPQRPSHLLQQAPLPPHYMKEELERLHRQYERLLRDERHAWADVMRKQKEAFDREKTATIQVFRNVAGAQQRENTEEIKRFISMNEVKRQRWQHAAEAKQNLALQRMLHTTMPSGITTTAAAETQRSDRHSPPILPRSSRGTPKRPSILLRTSRPKRVGTAPAVGGNGRGQRRIPVKGPYTVVLPPEDGQAAYPTAPESATNVSQERVDEVVVLSDDDQQNEVKSFPYFLTSGGARVYSGQRKAKVSLSSSPLLSRSRDEKGLVAQQAQQSLHTSPAKRLGSSLAGAASRRARTPIRGVGKLRQQRGGEKNKNDRVSPYAFSVKDLCVPSHVFDRTIEIPLPASSGSSNTAIPLCPSAESCPTRSYDSHLKNSIPIGVASSVKTGVSSRREADAVLLRGVVLLADTLTTEESAKRKELEECVVDTTQSSAPPVTKCSIDGSQRSCDIHYFGDERSAITPRRRAKLRAAEAQSRIEMRNRLERIKALSLSPRGEPFGLPPKRPQEPYIIEFEESQKRLEDLLANETIHSIIGEVAERELFADLMQQLERDMVRVELHRIASDALENKSRCVLQGIEKEEEGSKDVACLMEMVQGTGTMRSFFGAVHEELSLEQTVFRHIENALLQSFVSQRDEVEDREKGGEKGEKAVVDGVADDDDNINNNAAVSREVTVFESTPSDLLEGNTEEERKSTWVHEVVRTSTDPLWRTPEEAVVSSQPPLPSVPTLISKETREQQQRDVGEGSEGRHLPCATSSPGVFVAIDNAEGSAIRDDGRLVRIVLDVAPVVQKMATTALLGPTLSSLQQPAQRVDLASEDRRLLYASEEDLQFCEVVDAPRARDNSATREIPTAVTQSLKNVVIPPDLQMRMDTCSRGGADVFLPSPPAKQEGVASVEPKVEAELHLLTSLEGGITHAQDKISQPVTLSVEQRQWHEEEHRRELLRCQENEALQRQMLREQEDTLRASWCMMWDWQYSNLVALRKRQHEQHQQCAQANHFSDTTSTSAAVPPLPPPPPSTTFFAEERNDNHKSDTLPPVSSPMGIRDPVTRFIFEWMHAYSETKDEYPAKKSFVERLHEASFVADGKVPRGGEQTAASTHITTGGSAMESDVCRRLMMEMDNADSSTWLSSTNPSSMSDGGLQRFVSYLPRSGVTFRSKRTYRRVDENPSSATTETTHYSTPSSLMPDAHRGSFFSPPTFPTPGMDCKTSKTVTTSSTSRTWTSSDSSEKSRLREAHLRNPRYTQPQEQNHLRQEYGLEELRHQVEVLQDASRRDHEGC